MLFTLGLALALSVLNVYFRDTQHFVAIGMQIWFYLTPVLYPLSYVSDASERLDASGRQLFGHDVPVVGLYELNPLERFLSVFRGAAVRQPAARPGRRAVLPGRHRAVAGLRLRGLPALRGPAGGGAVSEAAIRVEGVSEAVPPVPERNQSLKAALMRGGRASYEEFWALRDVSFDIPRGATFGLMGVNGSGKSTLLKCIAGILQPDGGRVSSTGTMAALLELGSGFHPELSGRENVYLNGSILGLSRRELDARFDEIVDFAGVARFIDQPVKNYSSGMYVRLGFSVAINVEPEILLVDEVLAVGDQAFQEKCMAKFAEFRRSGRTVVLVSHALGSMRTMCDEIAWLDAGQLVETGSPQEIIDRYSEASHDTQAIPGAGSRWGSGEAQLSDVSLLDRDGLPTTLVHTGDGVTIRLRWETSRPVEEPVFGLTLWTREGVEIWSQHTRDAEFPVDRIEGRGEVDVDIPDLVLLPGAYSLSASIVDQSLTHQYDYRHHCYAFDVGPGPRRDSGGLVTMGGTWRTAPVSPLPST